MSDITKGVREIPGARDGLPPLGENPGETHEIVRERLWPLGDNPRENHEIPGARDGLPALENGSKGTISTPEMEAAEYLPHTIIGTESDNLDLQGRSGDDTIFGNGGQDYLFGLDGNDMLDGGSGNDMLYGGSGDDALYGGRGNDTIAGGGGNDFMVGSEGADTFDVYGGGQDVIKDFSIGERDKLDLSSTPLGDAIKAGNLGVLSGHSKQILLDDGEIATQLDLGGGDTVTLIGLPRNELIYAVDPSLLQ